LSNYYEILGIQSDASHREIKAAFRKLAMRHHPDKNPADKDYFSLILKAYETLSDSSRRTTYDYRLQYNLADVERNTTKKTTEKNWKFDEKELKRRRYYDEHIKKYAKTEEAETLNKEPKTTYNEFKYILFATPLAVILFLLVVKMASSPQSVSENNPLNNEAVNTPKKTLQASTLVNGDTPYSDYFGSGKYDQVTNHNLKINNQTDAELIVCLFTRTRFVRSFYVAKNYSAEISQLPSDSLFIKYCSGTHFDANEPTEINNLKGKFMKHLLFFKSIEPTRFYSNAQLTLLPGNNTGFTSTNEQEFYKK
jgi:curved DNA-binding protein CbpA